MILWVENTGAVGLWQMNSPSVVVQDTWTWNRIIEREHKERGFLHVKRKKHKKGTEIIPDVGTKNVHVGVADYVLASHWYVHIIEIETFISNSIMIFPRYQVVILSNHFEVG